MLFLDVVGFLLALVVAVKGQDNSTKLVCGVGKYSHGTCVTYPGIEPVDLPPYCPGQPLDATCEGGYNCCILDGGCEPQECTSETNKAGICSGGPIVGYTDMGALQCTLGRQCYVHNHILITCGASRTETLIPYRAVCQFECVHGICTSPNECTCSPGYTGNTCDIPVCQFECVHGICTSPNECTCSPGYTGNTCDIHACIDISPTCAHNAFQCNTNRYIQERCKKTCNLCENGSKTGANDEFTCYDDGFYGDLVQCDKYYDCYRGQKTKKLCPDGLIFDYTLGPHVERCEYAGIQLECPEGNSLQQAQASGVCPRQNGYFKHKDPTNCEEFYYCNNGNSTLHKCPEGLLFDEVNGRCDWESNVFRQGCIENNEMTILEVTELLFSHDRNNVFKDLTVHVEDNAAKLISTNDPNIFVGKKTYTTLRDLQLNGGYFPDVNKAETITNSRLQKQNAFIEAIMQTEVMKITKKFLQDKGEITNTNTLSDVLKEMWFTLYSRAEDRVTLGSSGFEHVFRGELKNDKVIGFHNWVFFFREQNNPTPPHLVFKKLQRSLNLKTKEKKGKIVQINFLWLEKNKTGGSMFIGSSPELEMAVYTICFLMTPRPSVRCPVSMAQKDFNIVTYTDKSNVKLVASAYAEVPS